MTTQAGLATSKVVILVLGAGVTTQIVLGKATLSDVIANIQDALFKGQKGDSGVHNADDAVIQAQIIRLAQEVKQLYGGRRITVVNASQRNSNVSSYILPLAVLGVAGYGYMWWKGCSFSDIMYVTKNSMANYVSSFTKQLEQVTTAISAAKKHLVQRMEKLTVKLEEQKETTGAIRFEVGEARESLLQMGLDIDTVQRLVEGLETQVDRVEGNQDHINAGVVYLCQFVQGLSGAQRPELVQYPPAKGRLEQSLSSTSGLGGLKVWIEAAAQTIFVNLIYLDHINNTSHVSSSCNISKRPSNQTGQLIMMMKLFLQQLRLHPENLVQLDPFYPEEGRGQHEG